MQLDPLMADFLQHIALERNLSKHTVYYHGAEEPGLPAFRRRQACSGGLPH